MSRTNRRISRSLTGVLIITLALGVAFYIKQVSQSRASEAQRPPAPAVALNTPPATKPAPPTTKPVELVLAPTVQVTPATKPTASAAGPLADALVKEQANDWLGARKELNDLLLSSKLSDSDTAEVKKALTDINQTVIFSTRRFDNDEFGGAYPVRPGDKLQKIADKYEIPWQLLLKVNGMADARKLQAGKQLKVINGPFNVVVSKSKFMLDLYLGPAEQTGSLYVMSYPVGLGKDDSTPTGTWMAEAGRKIKDPTYYSSRGEGVIESNDPKNPLGHRWIGLVGINGQAIGKVSYGIHGTIDETSIGRMDSMGCIRLHNADVESMFDMISDGKSIVVVRG